MNLLFSIYEGLVTNDKKGTIDETASISRKADKIIVKTSNSPFFLSFLVSK
jgi:hypothetical protein